MNPTEPRASTVVLDPEERTALEAILNDPAHRAGLEQRTWTLTGISDRAEGLVRISGTLSGDDVLVGWDGPNVAVRLAVPVASPELAGAAAITGAGTDNPGAGTDDPGAGEPGAGPATSSRVYTVAGFDAAQRRMDIDVVRHADPSPMMTWLAGARPGDAIVVTGPRGHQLPVPGEPRHFLADSSGLPALAGILAGTARGGSRDHVVVAAPEDHVDLFIAELTAHGVEIGADVSLVVVDPSAAGAGPLSEVFRSLDVPAGASVWAAGERDDIRAIRARCRDELGLPRERMRLSGYWRRGSSATMADLNRLRRMRELLAAGKGFDAADDLDLDVEG
ncbi:siderophore-interacting protein [Corynebacterium hansenii]|uniref:Siderophore-interacting protein n=1 Tax=Corynebacterium hansenii TaxID=394964 RepID=A0ABV7ZQV5_9CORY|nr:siderophore-interacting protein [Corynebacterium hansenii]WJZ00793.1 Vibriobactin utilization protein ViuB [Corynebacterium hansenii]